MFPDGLLDLSGLYGRVMVVDSSAEVICFTNVLLRANFATDERDAVVCVTRHVGKYLVGATPDGAFKTVHVGTVLAQKASGIRIIFIEFYVIHSISSDVTYRYISVSEIEINR